MGERNNVNVPRTQIDHISSEVIRSKGKAQRVMRPYVSHTAIPHPRNVDYIRNAGLLHVTEIELHDDIWSIINGLIERWRPETHTFHLPVGECTITLQDVAFLFGVPVSGRVITGSTRFKGPNVMDLIRNYLGVIPENKDDAVKKAKIKLPWLESTFRELPNNASEEVVQAHARAYLLRTIGRFLFPIKGGELVHAKWLKFIGENFNTLGEYSWGSALLASLYRELCRGAHKRTHTVAGPLLLLQSWLWYRIPSLAPPTVEPYAFPLVNRWKRDLANVYRLGKLSDVRTAIDFMQHDEFQWQPYESLMTLIPEKLKEHDELSLHSTSSPLVCFEIVEWHAGDRVRRQFGLRQDCPDEPFDLGDAHNKDIGNKNNEDWVRDHGIWIQFWQESAHHNGQHGYGVDNDYRMIEAYWQWYSGITREYLFLTEAARNNRPRSPSTIREHREDRPSRRRRSNADCRRRSNADRPGPSNRTTEDFERFSYSSERSPATMHQGSPSVRAHETAAVHHSPLQFGDDTGFPLVDDSLFQQVELLFDADGSNWMSDLLSQLPNNEPINDSSNSVSANVQELALTYTGQTADEPQPQPETYALQEQMLWTDQQQPYFNQMLPFEQQQPFSSPMIPPGQHQEEQHFDHQREDQQTENFALDLNLTFDGIEECGDVGLDVPTDPINTVPMQQRSPIRLRDRDLHVHPPDRYTTSPIRPVPRRAGKAVKELGKTIKNLFKKK